MFNITGVCLKPGRVNVLGDVPFRIPNTVPNQIQILGIDQDELGTPLDGINDNQAFGPIWRALNRNWPDDSKKKMRLEILIPNFIRSGNWFLYREKTCVPSKAVKNILDMAHDSRIYGHVGFAKALGRLEKFHCKHKTRDTKAYCGVF